MVSTTHVPSKPGVFFNSFGTGAAEAKAGKNRNKARTRIGITP